MNTEQINNLIDTCQQEIRRLQEENKKQKEVIQTYETLLKINIEENKQLKNTINKVKDYVNTTEYSDIVGLNSNSIKDFWFVKELLEILNNKGE